MCPAPALRCQRMKPWALIVTVVVLGLLAAGGGYLLGHAGGGDLGTAVLAGKRIGRHEGATAGHARGYTAGLGEGRAEGYLSGYQGSFRAARHATAKT